MLASGNHGEKFFFLFLLFFFFFLCFSPFFWIPLARVPSVNRARDDDIRMRLQRTAPSRCQTLSLAAAVIVTTLRSGLLLFQGPLERPRSRTVRYKETCKDTGNTGNTGNRKIGFFTFARYPALEKTRLGKSAIHRMTYSICRLACREMAPEMVTESMGLEEAAHTRSATLYRLGKPRG